jgi:hypothetical protein
LKVLFCKDIKTDLLSQENTLFEIVLFEKRKLISAHSKENCLRARM